MCISVIHRTRADFGGKLFLILVVFFTFRLTTHAFTFLVANYTDWTAGHGVVINVSTTICKAICHGHLGLKYILIVSLKTSKRYTNRHIFHTRRSKTIVSCLSLSVYLPIAYLYAPWIPYPSVCIRLYYVYVHTSCAIYKRSAAAYLKADLHRRSQYCSVWVFSRSQNDFWETFDFHSLTIDGTQFIY